MIIYKLEQDGTLLKTNGGMLYQYEHNADELLFLIPSNLDGLDLADGSVILRYILPDDAATGMTRVLKHKDETYGDFAQYFTDVTSIMTAFVGDIQLSLSVVDAKGNSVARSSTAVLHVNASMNTSDILEGGQLDQLDWLTMQVNKLNTTGAAGGVDDLTYDENSRKLQLVADGKLVGNAVVVPGDSFTGSGDDFWEDMDGDGEPDVPVNPDPPVEPEPPESDDGEGDIFWEDM